MTADDAARPAARSWAKVARSWLFFTAGVGLLGWVLHSRGGFGVIASVVDRLSTTWPLLLVPMAINGVLLVLAYRSALPERGRAVPFLVLVRVERSSSVLNSLLPFGAAGGAVMKVALLRHWYRTDQIVAASMWGSLATGLGSAFAALGPLSLLVLGLAPAEQALPLAIVNALTAAPALVVVSLLPRGLGARIARLVARFPGALRRSRERIVAWAGRLDRNLADAVGTRRGDFAMQVGFKIGAQIVRVGEITMVLALLGIDGGLPLALLYHSLTRATDTVFSFVPGQLGVTELAAATGFAAIGLPGEQGLALALTLRFRYFATMVLSASAVATSGSVLRRYPPRGEPATDAR